MRINKNACMDVCMDVNTKLALLGELYRIYADAADHLDLACAKGCAHCCTVNVTLTSLEGYRLLQGLGSVQRRDLVQRIRDASPGRRFQPQFSFNQLAERCRDGRSVPAEVCDPAWGVCPLLADQACLFYRWRPFACRCMVSRLNCGRSGQAQMDEWVLTLNHVMLQFIEHVDADGFSGNLGDVLSHMARDTHRQAYAGPGTAAPPPPLIANRRLSILMIPPEHRRRMAPILTKIYAIGK